MRARLFASVVLAMIASAANATVLRLQVNHTTRLHLSGRASSVIIGNPNVADATVVDSRTVFVSGRATGSTDVIVMDALGRTLYAGDVAVGPSGAAVTVFRGPDQQSLACAPVCGPQDAAAASSPLASMAPAMGGATAPYNPGGTAMPQASPTLGLASTSR